MRTETQTELGCRLAVHISLMQKNLAESKTEYREGNLVSISNITEGKFDVFFEEIAEYEYAVAGAYYQTRIDKRRLVDLPPKPQSAFLQQVEANQALCRGKEVYVTPVRGFDAYTVRKMRKVVAQFVDESATHFLQEFALSRELNLLCIEAVLPVTVENAAQRVFVKYSADPALLQTDFAFFVEKVSPETQTATHTDVLPFLVALLELAAPQTQSFPTHSKGLGTVCIAPTGLQKGQFVQRYLGTLYPFWRWFEREENLKVLRTKLNSKESQPNFYNMLLEKKPKDAQGYDCLVVDPAQKGNFTSRVSHSCAPNLCVKSVAVGGRYSLVVKALRDVAPFEELAFDYCCRSDNPEEVKKAICLCGTRNCRGSYLYYFDDSFSDFFLLTTHSLTTRFCLLEKAVVLASSMARLRARKNKAWLQRLDQHSETVRVVDTDPAEAEVALLEAALARKRLGRSVLEDCPAWLRFFVAEIVYFTENSAQTINAKMFEFRRLFPGRLCSEDADEEALKADTKFVLEKYLHSCAIMVDRLKHVLRYQPSDCAELPPIAALNEEETRNYLVGEFDRLAKILQQENDNKAGRQLNENVLRLQERLRLESRLAVVRKELTRFCAILSAYKPRRKRNLQLFADALFLKSKTVRFFKATAYREFVSEFAEVGIVKNRGLRDFIVHKQYPNTFILTAALYWFKDTTDLNEEFFDFYKKGTLVLPSLVERTDESAGSRIEHNFYRTECCKALTEGREWPYFNESTFEVAELIGSPFLDYKLGLTTLEEYNDIVELFRKLGIR